MADFGISEALAAVGLSSAAEAGAAGTVAAEAGAAGAVGAASSAVGEAALGGSSLASYLPSLGTIGTGASLAGTYLQTQAGLSNTEYQSAVARAQAAELQQKANQDVAAGEQTAIARDRQTDLALSRGRAIAAASGAGATDPTVLDIEGNLAEQGRYNTLTGIYEGQAQARSEAQQAAIDLFRAQRTEAGALPAAAGTVLQGLSSFADKRARLRYFTTTGDASAGASP